MAYDVKLMPFDEWLAEVKSIAWHKYYFSQQSVDSFDADAWRVSYDEGMTPAEAMLEELSNA